MRHFLTILVLLFASVSLFGQIVNMPFSYTASSSAVDAHGNLIIFDTTYSITVVPAGTVTVGAGSSGPAPGAVNLPVTSLPIRQVLPNTRVTVVPGGVGQPISKQYAATFEVIGTGKWALYASAAGYTMSNNQVITGARKLIAIDAGTSGTALPTDFSGFLNADLNPGDVKLTASTGSAPDRISNIELTQYYPIGFGSPLPPTAIPVKARMARTITFDGTRFASTDVVLPQ
jgi:hypothetical protein